METRGAAVHAVQVAAPSLPTLGNPRSVPGNGYNRGGKEKVEKVYYMPVSLKQNNKKNPDVWNLIGSHPLLSNSANIPSAILVTGKKLK